MIVYAIFAYHFFFYSTIYIDNLLYINNGDDMRKKFRTKKKFKFKKIVYLLLIIFVIVMFKFYIMKIKLINSNEKLINNLLESTNYYSYNNRSNTNIIDTITSYISKNVFNSPLFFLKSELKTNIDKKTKSNINKVEFVYEENDLPLVYIYNSHQGENYSVEYLEEHNIIPNVLMAANMLKDKLENIKIKTIVENSDILDYMKKNNLNHAGSYIASRNFLEKAINKYTSVELFIDLHRDAATHKATSTEINGKNCAKILFVIGLENPNYEENLEVVTKINNIILEKYPTLTRGIMKKEGYGVNGVYNQDLNSNVILLEMGGNENNIDEINNTLDIISSVIGEYLNEKKEKE